tara:strand:- start:100 stop:483 length:384 start_codon:yes stop_codon:yes gene_type:complete
MNLAVSPPGIAPPVANYVHAVVSEAPSRLLHTSGVVPVSPDGSVSDDIGDQASTVWANLQAILADAKMAVDDIVSVTTYVVAGEDLRPVMDARDTALGDHHAASTLVTVPELAQSTWRLEVAIIAAC